MKTAGRFAIALATAAVFAGAGGSALAAAAVDGAASKAGLTTKDALAAKDLAKAIAGPQRGRPLLLHIGFQRLYRAGHIPGSRYVGAAYTPEGLAGLRQAVKGERPDREIVVYCGCCPWKDCPNVLPALKELRRLGFKKVRALYIPQDFHTDWADHGHPVVKGD